MLSTHVFTLSHRFVTELNLVTKTPKRKSAENQTSPFRSNLLSAGFPTVLGAEFGSAVDRDIAQRPCLIPFQRTLFTTKCVGGHSLSGEIC